MYVAGGRAGGAEPSKPFGSEVPDLKHGATGFDVCPAGFGFVLVHCLLSVPPFFPFAMRICILGHCMVKVCN